MCNTAETQEILMCSRPPRTQVVEEGKMPAAEAENRHMGRGLVFLAEKFGLDSTGWEAREEKCGYHTRLWAAAGGLVQALDYLRKCIPIAKACRTCGFSPRRCQLTVTSAALVSAWSAEQQGLGKDPNNQGKVYPNITLILLAGHLYVWARNEDITRVWTDKR